jgi:hypothetical protein
MLDDRHLGAVSVRISHARRRTMTDRTRVVTHQVRRLEVAVDLPFEEFRGRY